MPRIIELWIPRWARTFEGAAAIYRTPYRHSQATIVSPAASSKYTTLEPHSLTCHAWCMAGESREFPAAAIAALTKGHKIEAIKIVRQEWSLGLKEAKE